MRVKKIKKNAKKLLPWLGVFDRMRAIKWIGDTASIVNGTGADTPSAVEVAVRPCAAGNRGEPQAFIANHNRTGAPWRANE